MPFSRAAMPEEVEQSHGSPRRQNQQSRQGGCQLSTTWSPTAARVT
jgi:hypothetical protein